MSWALFFIHNTGLFRYEILKTLWLNILPGTSVWGDSPGKNTGAIPSSRGSSQARDQTQVSHIAGRFFIIWATREAKKIFKHSQLWVILKYLKVSYLEIVKFLRGKYRYLKSFSDNYVTAKTFINIFITLYLYVFSHSVASNSFWPRGLQQARPPCPSPTPRVCSNSCPLSWWCRPTIPSSVIPLPPASNIYFK